jgi:hypothetical protein
MGAGSDRSPPAEGGAKARTSNRKQLRSGGEDQASSARRSALSNSNAVSRRYKRSDRRSRPLRGVLEANTGAEGVRVGIHSQLRPSGVLPPRALWSVHAPCRANSAKKQVHVRESAQGLQASPKSREVASTQPRASAHQDDPTPADANG